MDAWIKFWELSFGCLVALYYVIAIVLIPLGIRDLFALFKRLNENRNNVEPQINADSRRSNF